MKTPYNSFLKFSWSILLLLLDTALLPCQAQVPFQRTGQVFLVVQNPSEIVEFNVTPAGNSLNINTLSSNSSTGIDAIGFRKTDNLLYGISSFNNHLIRMDATGALQDLGQPPLDNQFVYLAGDVSPDGNFLYSIGSAPGGSDAKIARTDLGNTNFTTTFVPLTGNWQLVDIAFDLDGVGVFGYDRLSRQIVRVNVINGTVTPLNQIELENEIEGLYFDAFGDLYAYGRSVFGIVDALFLIDKMTGKETRLATGPVFPVLDAASCPFSVEMKNSLTPVTTLACSDLTSTYSLVNGSGQTISGIDFVERLPPGFYIDQVLENSLGVSIDTTSQPGSFRFNNIELGNSVKKLVVKLLVSDVPEGGYATQAELLDLPSLYGLQSLSDNQASGGFEDSTRINIAQYDNDTLAYFWFICHGETLTLDGSGFGNDIMWNTGESSPAIDVTQGGSYNLSVFTRCSSFDVAHEVTSASCPYTISIGHEFVPDTIFACNDVLVRYILNNSSGELRYNIAILDTLPIGFSFKEVLDGPSGMSLKPNLPPNVVWLEGITLPLAKDTIDIRVKVQDIAPGVVYNRAVLYNLPQVMGPIRNSDYWKTPTNDATPLVIRGSLADTVYIDTVVCENAVLELDASLLGENFEWQNGSTDPIFPINEPGTYLLTIFDGCNPADVIWQIEMGAAVNVQLAETDSIHQGETLELFPQITNEGDSLALAWQGSTLTCLDCVRPMATPLESTNYTLIANNGACADTASIAVFVDSSRRIYAPNAFSPNDDGINDFFYLQSPDYGIIKHMLVVDRWGGLVFERHASQMNLEIAGWDGSANGKLTNLGTYTWMAEIEFIDGKSSVFSGSVTIIR
ncbi:MAG: gliding motility-associated C-terminal domain-containing protein [Saprospiraceae bacterium]|nr:gliding motility-associated C-terminal domain-containing protein [Saprospiraceae bacterium]